MPNVVIRKNYSNRFIEVFLQGTGSMFPGSFVKFGSDGKVVPADPTYEGPPVVLVERYLIGHETMYSEDGQMRMEYAINPSDGAAIAWIPARGDVGYVMVDSDGADVSIGDLLRYGASGILYPYSGAYKIIAVALEPFNVPAGQFGMAKVMFV